MNGYSYVYILEAKRDPARHYVGLTDELADRLARHNRGEVKHTASGRPWRLKSAVAFRLRERAAAFERYLKTGSGRAFARRRL